MTDPASRATCPSGTGQQLNDGNQAQPDPLLLGLATGSPLVMIMYPSHEIYGRSVLVRVPPAE
jgi:hypothetical protein